jgi:hypothetical protein
MAKRKKKNMKIYNMFLFCELLVVLLAYTLCCNNSSLLRSSLENLNMKNEYKRFGSSSSGDTSCKKIVVWWDEKEHKTYIVHTCMSHLKSRTKEETRD